MKNLFLFWLLVSGNALAAQNAGLSESAVLTMLGLATIAAAAYLFWRLPKRVD